MTGRSQSRRMPVRLAVAALMVASLVGLTGGGAGAGDFCPVPPAAPDADGRIRTLPAGPLVGNGVYNLTGNSQTGFDSLLPGEKANFEVTYRNASTNTRTITIGLFDVGGDFEDFVVKVFRGDRNITERFFDLGKRFKSKPPGSTTAPLRVQVRMRASASEFDNIALDLSGAYGKPVPKCGDNVGIEAGSIT